MVCFKKWIKTTGDPIEHFDGVKIPQVLEILDPSAVINDYLTDDEKAEKREQEVLD